jgi:hypothetical protein
MLGIHGARSMKVTGDDGKEHKLSPTDWMLDTLFRPTLAVQLPTFRIDNSNVLKSIGVDPRGRRDRYSYQEIEPGIEKLVDLAKSYEKIDSKKRDPEQQQVIGIGGSDVVPLWLIREGFATDAGGEGDRTGHERDWTICREGTGRGRGSRVRGRCRGGSASGSAARIVLSNGPRLAPCQQRQRRAPR